MTVVRTLAVSLALLVGAALVAAVTFVAGVRSRHPRVLRIARTMQRDVFNRVALQDAGAPGSPWAVVRAPGRVSGTLYDTPVGVQRVGDDLYISLPYGEGTQWLRNVRAAGRATILHDGHEIEATGPELVPIGQTPIAAAVADRVAISLFGITHALRLHAASEVPTAAR
jgi:deazaflavin-dependent oxidoreductase (nitroreductase family)